MKITHSYGDITTWFLETLETLLASQEIVFVGLAGGSSFDGWYHSILDKGSKIKDKWKKIDTNRIRWCVTDERVNCALSERNDAHIWDVFLSKLCEM